MIIVTIISINFYWEVKNNINPILNDYSNNKTLISENNFYDFEY